MELMRVPRDKCSFSIAMKFKAILPVRISADFSNAERQGT